MINKTETSFLIERAIDQAKVFCENYQYPLAKNFCEQVLKIDPKHAEAWLLLGIAQTYTKNTCEAKQSFENAAQFAEHEKNKQFALDLVKKVSIM